MFRTALLLAPTALAASAGDPDPSFDGDGKAILPFVGAPRAVLVQPDGKLALVGSRWGYQKPADFVITRLRSDGAPDAAKAPEPADFGGEDWVVTGAAAPGGKILAVGTTRASGAPQSEDVVAAARWSADGSQDKTFAETGKKKLGPGKPVAVVGQPDGGVLIVLRAENGDPSVTRLTNEGEVDTAFGDAGTATALSDGEKLATDVAAVVRPDGRAYVAGTPGSDTLRGTRRADVIVALGGNDKVLARGAGPDRCVGSGGPDRAAGCERRSSL